MSKDYPLVSVCLICYNQEVYIEKTLTSYLAQTYSPLEIVVSDDCSSDRTYTILQRIKREYNGPHKLIIHQNAQNQRIIRNLCGAMKLAHGELIVKADGDDIAMPNRVETLVSHWISAGKEPYCLCSAYQKIDDNDHALEHIRVPFSGIDKRSIYDKVCGNGYFYLGAASAYRRDILEYFPEVEFRTACDDSVFTVRGGYAWKTVCRT